VVTIAAPADRVYAALGEIGRWWDPAHTFSRDAANLSIELRAGGCFCERLKDGPLQAEGVDGTLSWTLKPVEGGTNVTLSYVVGGYIRTGMEQWAPRVDRVLDAQLQRLKGFVEGNSETR
jgi:hypothetical protein